MWVWTGFLYEYLSHDAGIRHQLLSLIDVLVDGPFIQALFQPNLAYKGSLNQRVINVPASLKRNPSHLCRRLNIK